MQERMEGSEAPDDAPESEEDRAAMALMVALVDLSGENWVSPDRFTRLAEGAGATEVELKIHFLTGVKRILRELPPQIFIDLDQRQSILNAVQEALDAAIDEEEGY